MTSPRKTVFITGASAGIGAATARLAAANGWDVALHYRADRAGAEATAKACEAAGAKTLILQADMADPATIPGLFRQIDATFPRLDALVNNAGQIGQSTTIAEMDAARLATMFAVNTTAPFLCAGEAVRRMSSATGGQGGVIVNISSAAARLGAANNYADYAASKAAIDILTKALAEETARFGIRVNGIRPGIIDTPIHGRGGQPDRAARLANIVPMGRPGTADEIAQAVLWLMSDAASYVTGATLDVTGGR